MKKLREEKCQEKNNFKKKDSQTKIINILLEKYFDNHDKKTIIKSKKERNSYKKQQSTSNHNLNNIKSEIEGEKKKKLKKK